MLVGYVDPSGSAIAGDYKDLKFKNNLDYQFLSKVLLTVENSHSTSGKGS